MQSRFQSLHKPSLAMTGVMSFLFVGSVSVRADIPMPRMAGNRPPIMAQAQKLSPSDPNQVLSLAILMPVHNQAAMDSMMRRMYDPTDKMYHHYITPAQFANLFGPTPAEYAQAQNWAAAQGLRVTQTYANRLLFDVQGAAGAAESAFHVRLSNYLMPDGRICRAPDQDPATPNVPIAGVAGLDNVAVPHPQYTITGGPLFRNIFTPMAFGSGPAGGYAPSDIKTAYNMNSVTQTGVGQNLALMELDGFVQTNITQYETQFGLPNITLHVIPAGGASGKPSGGGGEVEVELDIEMMAGIAPNASGIDVYEGPNSYTGLLDTYATIASYDVDSQGSSSWGTYELFIPRMLSLIENYFFIEMGLQGQSMYVASGDSGAFDYFGLLDVGDAADLPNAVGVGGTTLTTNGPGGSRLSEVSWWDAFGDGGGGGASVTWPIPYYQIGFIKKASLGSPITRNVPDVCLNADPNTGYDIFSFGQWFTVGGTSAAAPLWAGFTALVNQGLVAQGNRSLGFPNPTLYKLASGPNYNNDFYDITQGNNGYYPALPGYDDSTGLGSYNGQNLLNDILAGDKKVIGPPAPYNRQLLLNTGFENGVVNPSPWVASSPSIISNNPAEPPNTGKWDAWLGGHNAPQVDTLSQTVNIPRALHYATLSFYLHIDSQENPYLPIDTLQIFVINVNTGQVVMLKPIYSNMDSASGYQQVQFNMRGFAGGAITIELKSTQRTSIPTNFVVDDFALNVG